MTFLPWQEGNHVLAFPWSCASVFGGRASMLQPGSRETPSEMLGFHSAVAASVFCLVFLPPFILNGLGVF